MENVKRGWVVTNEEGTVLKQCANCEGFTKCEKKPNWNYKVCKNYTKLESKGE